MKSDMIFNVKEKDIKKTRTKRVLFISAIVLVVSIVILNLVTFLIA